MKKSPNQGGCWFCNDDDPKGLVLEREFDTFVHFSCLREKVKDPENQEAQIMSYLLKYDNDGDSNA